MIDILRWKVWPLWRNNIACCTKNSFTLHTRGCYKESSLLIYSDTCSWQTVLSITEGAAGSPVLPRFTLIPSQFCLCYLLFCLSPTIASCFKIITKYVCKISLFRLQRWRGWGSPVWGWSWEDWDPSWDFYLGQPNNGSTFIPCL